MRNEVIAVDLGGTQMRAARFDSENTMRDRAVHPTEVNKGVGSIVERLAELIQQVYPPVPDQLTGVGVAAPGPLDVKTGTILDPPNLPFSHTPLRDELYKRLGVRVVLLNDADAAALGEHRHGAGQGAENMVYLTLGTGLGGGLILNGELYQGRGQAGEVGFMSIAAGNPISGAPPRGYAEYILSGTGIARRARERVAAEDESQLSTLETITGKDVALAAEAGDALAMEIIEETGGYLGVLVASLMMLLHPDIVVIGGSVTALGPMLFEPMQATIKETCIDPVYYKDTPVRPAALGDDAGLVGAALYAVSELGHDEFPSKQG